MIAGHSHVQALGFSPLAVGDGPNLIPLSVERDDVYGFATADGPYSPKYWDKLVEIARGKDILILWIGSQHLAEFLFQEGEPFDFLIASRPDLPVDSSVKLVPESLVRHYQMSFLSALDAFLERLKDVGDSRVFIGATPPPKGDDDALKTLLTYEDHFQRRARMLGLDIGTVRLTAPAVRLKLWLVIHELLNDIAEKHRSTLLPVPDEAIDENGFLRLQYWENDVGHGNTDYGALFLKSALPAIDGC